MKFSVMRNDPGNLKNLSTKSQHLMYFSFKIDFLVLAAQVSRKPISMSFYSEYPSILKLHRESEIVDVLAFSITFVY